MTNPICQALDIKYPILLGGLLKIGTAPLWWRPLAKPADSEF